MAGTQKGTVGLSCIGPNEWRIEQLPNRIAMRGDVNRMYLWSIQNCTDGFSFDSKEVPLAEYPGATYNSGKRWLYATFKFDSDSDSNNFGSVWMFGAGKASD